MTATASRTGTRPPAAPDRLAWLARRGVRRTLVGAYVLALGALLWPALTVPIGTDDSVWVLVSAPHGGAGVRQFFGWVFGDMGAQPEDMGRFAQGSYVLQRFADILTMNAAVTTGLPPWVFRVALKVVLLALATWTALALVRRVATRTGPDRQIAVLPAPAVAVVGWTLPVVVAVGANAVWLGDINGWVDYPVLTYGGVVVMLGVPLLLLRVVDAWHRRGRVVRALLVALLVVVAMFLNNSYELYLVAFPLGLIVLFLQPVPPEARRPRLWVAGTFSVAFVVFLVYYRVRVAQICAEITCYDGASLHLGPETARVLRQNLFGAFPGGTREQVGNLLWHVGKTSTMPQAFPPSYVVLGLLAVLVVAGLVWHSLAQVPGWVGGILVRLAAVGVLAAAGSAVLVSVNERVAGLLRAPGIPFRAGVMVWFGWSLALVALVLWAALRAGRFRRHVVLAALVVLAATIAHTLPLNLVGARAYASMPAGLTVNEIHEEVARGDITDGADARRCELLARFYELNAPSNRRTRIARGADLAFRHYHGTHFCTTVTGSFDDPFGTDG